MEVITGLMEVPVGTKSRKRRVAEQMAPVVSGHSRKFDRAWKKYSWHRAQFQTRILDSG
jgi:hypothetical protein